MNTNPVENKTFLNKARNFMFGNKKANVANVANATPTSTATTNGNKSFVNKAKNYMFGNNFQVVNLIGVKHRQLETLIQAQILSQQLTIRYIARVIMCLMTVKITTLVSMIHPQI